jgi:hypothetical protein
VKLVHPRNVSLINVPPVLCFLRTVTESKSILDHDQHQRERLANELRFPLSWLEALLLNSCAFAILLSC